LPLNLDLVPCRLRAKAREREGAVRQLTFEDLMEQPGESPILLDPMVQTELVRIMAAAIAVMHEKGGDGDDAAESVQQ
jgi:hypothetical protein